MAQNYKQLGAAERVQISLLLEAGLSVREISVELSRSPATVSREIRRNRAGKGSESYNWEIADKSAFTRRHKARKGPRLKSKFIREYVQEKLRIGWSPELIAGRLSLENPKLSISHEAIYQFIYREAREYIGFLPQARKKRLPRRRAKIWGGAPIPKRISISKRPAEANERSEIGHWEVDTVRSSVNGRTALAVALDRHSRYVRLGILAAKNSSEFERFLLGALSPLQQSFRKTITYDNGAENACHLRVNSKLHTESFFCRPYHSWEKGSVENSISLLRRFIPYRSNLDTLSPQKLAAVEAWINNRPKKCLNFKTPYEIFSA